MNQQSEVYTSLVEVRAYERMHLGAGPGQNRFDIDQKSGQLDIVGLAKLSVLENTIGIFTIES